MKTVLTALVVTAVASSTAFAGGSCGSHGSSYHVRSYSSYPSTYRTPQRVEPREVLVDKGTGEEIIYQSKRKVAGAGLAVQESPLKVQSQKVQKPLGVQKPTQFATPVNNTAQLTKQRPVIQSRKIQANGQGAVVPMRPDVLLDEELGDEEAVLPGDELDVDPRLLDRPQALAAPQSLDGLPVE